MDEFKWTVVGGLVFFALFIGSMVYLGHLRHVERMECTKAKGDYIDGACRFHGPKQ